MVMMMKRVLVSQICDTYMFLYYNGDDDGDDDDDDDATGVSVTYL